MRYLRAWQDTPSAPLGATVPSRRQGAVVPSRRVAPVAAERVRSEVAPIRSPTPSPGASILQKKRVAFALAANQLLSSGTHLIAKGAMTAIGPLPVALLRFAAASAALLFYQRFRAGAESLARRDVPLILFLGFLVVPVNQGCFLFGLSHSTPSHAALLYALTPVVVLLLAGRILRERGTWSKLAGMAVAFAGVVVILVERGLKRDLGVFAGDLLILAAVFGWSLYTVLSKPLLARHDPMTVTTWAIVSGTALCLPAFFIPGALPPLRTIGPAVWGGIFYLAIGTSVIAYPLWMYALRHLEASKVAVATNTQPILTAALSWIFLREQLTPGFFVGAALILAGVTWVETRRSA